ncbi:MAG: tetratricopeptide repeat protein [Acidimicrobiia bacterium]|nr:tetratricopeptide repeat protein [Acidimicrobiia bacterium]
MEDKGPETYKFGEFVVNLSERVLYRDGRLVPLTPKVFETLAVLVERQGKVVHKAELLKLVWPDSFVEENSLTQNISALRKVFEDKFIETIPRRGYRFVAAVEADKHAEPRRRNRRWIWALAALGALLAVSAVAWRRKAGPDRRVESLVVLPFVNLTGEQADEYFSDGLTEELTNRLAQIAGLRVVARTTAYQFRNKPQDIRSIARQLDVTTVIEGSVRRDKQKMRVTVQLIDAGSGYHLWSQTYDREEGELFRIQEDISAQVAQIIRPSVVSIRPAAAIKNREAYNLYLLGRYHLNQPDDEAVRKAIAYFQQATEKEPDYAGAHAGLAECYLKLAQHNAIGSVEAWGEAQKAGRKAIELDENLAEAHTTLGISHLILDWNWEAAERRFRRAIELNPNEANAHHWFSHYYSVFGRSSESLRESQEALKLSPLDPRISGHLVFHYLRARDFPGAIRAGTEALNREPENRLAKVFLAYAYECAGEWDNAVDALTRSAVPHAEEAALRAALRSEGPAGYWRVNRDHLAKLERPDHVRLAVCHARLGEPEKALAQLEQAFWSRRPDMIHIKQEPAFDSLHGQPRFRALVEAMRLP